MRNFIPIALGLSLSIGLPNAHAQSYRETGAYAITGVKIVSLTKADDYDFKNLPTGTILLRNGKIQAVGKNVVIPPDAEIIKGDGLTAYPGLIDSYNKSGLTLPLWQPVQDTLPDTSSIAPPFMREANRKGVRPELRAVENLTLTDAVLNPLRKEGGFTASLFAPSGGTINGVGVFVDLSGKPKREAVLRPETGMSFTFGTSPESGGGTGYPGSLLGIIAHIRQTLLDSRHYSDLTTGKFAESSEDRPPYDVSLESLKPLLSRNQPVLFEADNENEIVRAIHLSEEFKFNLIIVGGADAWKQAKLLADKKIPVIVSLNFGEDPAEKGKKPDPPKQGDKPKADETKPVPPKQEDSKSEPPTPNDKKTADDKPGVKAEDKKEDKKDEKKEDKKPEEEDEATPKAVIEYNHTLWTEKVANALKLTQAGVEVRFTTNGVKSPGEFMKNLRLLIKAGMPKYNALYDLSHLPSSLFPAQTLGRIEAGAIANLTLMSGDIFDEKSKVKRLFISKTKFDMDDDNAPVAPPTRRRPREIE